MRAWMGAVLTLGVFAVATACRPEPASIEAMTPLEAAIVVDLSPEKVKMLLESGADPNQRSTRGYTPLIYASDELRVPGERERLSADQIRQADEIVALLLKHGANPNIEPERGYSALSAAIAANRSATVGLLLGAGADPNGGRVDSGTPLMLAAHHCRLEIARTLLEHGADPARRDESGALAADLAERAGCSDVADLVRRAPAMRH